MASKSGWACALGSAGARDVPEIDPVALNQRGELFPGPQKVKARLDWVLNPGFRPVLDPKAM